MSEGMGQGVHPLERPEVPMKIKVRENVGGNKCGGDVYGLGSVSTIWLENHNVCM